jgi:hypothetical protein
MTSHQPPIDFTPLLRDLTEAATRVRSGLRPSARAVLPPNADFTIRRVAEAIGLDHESMRHLRRQHLEAGC